MTKINTNISIDSNLKKDAVSLFNDFGLDLSTAITLFLQQSVREQRIPFEIKKEIPNKVTKEALDEFDEMKKDKSKYKRYNSFKDISEEV